MWREIGWKESVQQHHDRSVGVGVKVQNEGGGEINDVGVGGGGNGHWGDKNPDKTIMVRPGGIR